MDNHLRNPDFLDVERYPTIEFHTSKVEALPRGEGKVPDERLQGVVAWEPRADHFRVTGPLTLRGVTREAELDTWYFGQATDTRGMTRRAFRAQTSIRRVHFAIYEPPQIDPARVVAGQVVDLSLEIIANRRDE
jgi:polyisoprenoid-binding protein YceI